MRARLGINNCFAVKRWPQPDDWARIVRDELGLDTVELSLDLIEDVGEPSSRQSAGDGIRSVLGEYGLRAETVFTGLAAYSLNLLMHPDAGRRQAALDWYRGVVDLAARVGARGRRPRRRDERAGLGRRGAPGRALAGRTERAGGVMTSGFVYGNGIDIHYRISGEGPSALVLINGVGDDLDGWVNQVDDFVRAGLRVISYDNRGAGRSGSPPGPYTSAEMAADLKALVAGLRLPRFHLAGVSMGGAIAQEYAVAHPGDLRLRPPDRRGAGADAGAGRQRRHHHPAGTVAAAVRRAGAGHRHLGGRARRPRRLLGEPGVVEPGHHRFRPPQRRFLERSDLAMTLEERFGTAKPVIAMVHFPGLPGRPRHDRAAGRARLVDVVGRDLEVLQDAGVDALLFCNENDIPYQLAVGPEIPAAMAAVIGELRPSIRVPFGVNVLWDPRASLAVARATGAVFIREVLTGVYESDMGLIAPSLGDLAAYRDAIGASDVGLFGNITPEFSSTIGTRTVAERARSSSFLGLDAILISGPEAGVPFVMSDLRAAKQAAPQTPVLANTGVTADRLAETLAVADGVIVGTSLKVDGITWNPVDPARAARFVDTAREVRSAPAVVS